MAGEAKSFDSPDETRPFEGKAQAQLVNLGGKSIGEGVFDRAGGGRRTSSPSPRPTPAKPIELATACRVA